MKKSCQATFVIRDVGFKIKLWCFCASQRRQNKIRSAIVLTKYNDSASLWGFMVGDGHLGSICLSFFTETAGRLDACLFAECITKAIAAVVQQGIPPTIIPSELVESFRLIHI